MSANWRTGKVEKVKVGADGCVRQVTITYTDSSSDNPEDWLLRSVYRPVRNIVRISHIEGTTFMDDLNDVDDLALKIINPEDVPNVDNKPEVDIRSEPSNIPAALLLDDHEAYTDDLDDETFTEKDPENLPPPALKKRKMRKTELENLEITLKGWNLAKSKFQAMSFTHAISQSTEVQTDTAVGYDEGEKELIREGENEDADIEFNCVTKDYDFDDLYLL